MGTNAAQSKTTKHIFVTGGVVSSLGKGLTAASLGNLLTARGLHVVMQKLDPYLNVDPGTMNPFEHGEVFVTDDGAETDLDIGHYERFLGIDLSRAAATRLNVIGPGTARVRVQSLGDVERMQEDGDLTGAFYVQVGAFADRINADNLISILSQSGNTGRLVYGSNNMWNVQVGPWPDSFGAQRQLDVFRGMYPGAFVVGDN